MAYAAQQSLYELKDNLPGLTVISPNDPGAMIRFVQECQDLGMPYVYDPSQQLVRLDAEDVRRGILGALALFVNDYEFALIQKMTGMNADEMINHMGGGLDGFIVVTRGEQDTWIFTREARLDIPVVKPERIIDPTGVGDAFRGGFLTGYVHKLDLKTCGRMGALAATYCLEQRGPQGHSYKPAEFVTRYRQLHEDWDRLDNLFGR
jgi:adenosine kinase